MNKTKIKTRICFFFSLVCTLLLSACGVKNHHGFVGEDARFAKYTQLGKDSAGLVYYADDTNPNEIAVGLGTCTAQNIVVNKYNNKPVTSVYPSGFQKCTTIKTISLPDTVTTFGTDAFAESTIESITIPNGLTAISSGAFRNCRSLTTVNFKENNQVARIGDYAFANDYKLSSFLFPRITNLTTIGNEAFLYCLGLTNVILPDSFTTLGSYAFQDCKNLVAVYFPASVTVLGPYAFKGVGESAKIYFSETMEKTAQDCNIQDSNIPASFANEHNFSYGTYHVPVVWGVGALKPEGPFRFSTPNPNTYSLNVYNKGNSLTEWTDSGAIEYTETIAPDEVILMSFDDQYPNFDQTNIQIPATIWGGAYKVVGIASDVFKGNTLIQSVKFNENLRFIDAGAFANCTSITSIDLAGAIDLEHIQSHAFYNTLRHGGNYDVGHMYSVHIPSSVVNIDQYAFRGCTGLFKIYFDGASDEYEETFICNGSTKSFELAYAPQEGVVQSVKVAGPTTNNYTVSGKTVTLNDTPAAKTVVKIKYTIGNTATQTFKGHEVEDQNGDLVLCKDFILSSKAATIASVTVGSDAKTLGTDYTTSVSGSAPNEKTKITFTNAPAVGETISVTYVATSKLQKIGEYAFYGCSDNIGDQKYSSLVLRSYDDPYQEVHFPASLTEIGQYAFADSQVVGGVSFESDSLTIGQYAFYSVESLSSISFPETMTSLTLEQYCFASNLGVADYAAGNRYKKLFSVILPSDTTLGSDNVGGDYIFFGHIFLNIYCINNLPSGNDTYGNWKSLATIASNSKGAVITTFGDFSGDGNKLEMDRATVYTITGKSDVVSLPDDENPIFDFVKVGSGNNVSATLTNYHFYGGRIKDQNGNTAIKVGETLNDYNTNNINSRYSSQYAVRLNSGHFKFVIPSQVYIGNSFVPVTKIGDRSLAVQINESNLHPKTVENAPRLDTEPTTGSYNCWLVTSNFWTMREIILPNSITSIGDAAMAVIPFTTVRSYDPATASILSGDRGSYIYDTEKAISDEGVFPTSLVSIGKKAFVFSGITKAILPGSLIEYGGITGSSAPNTTYAFADFPFMGCFNLTLLRMTADSSVFKTYDDGVIIYNKTGSSSKGIIIEGAEGKTTIDVPWGTTKTVDAAFRGGRNINTVRFPYTLTGIPKRFLDAIGSSRDSDGRTNSSALETVTFEKGSYYTGVSESDQKKYNTSKCSTIGQSAFYGCNSLKNVELPVGLTSIGKYSFRYCDMLDNLTVDKGVLADNPFTNTDVGDTHMGPHLNCTELPNLGEIGDSAFEGCFALTQVTTNDKPNLLKNGSSFKNCTGLTTVTINSATTPIGGSCFQGCTSLNTVTFNGSSSRTINASAFQDCTALGNVSFNGNIILNGSAFKNCSSLTTATFASTSDIKNDVFNNCKLLETVTFGGTTSIGTTAFYDCDGLKKIDIPQDSTIGTKAFQNCDGFNSATGGTGIIIGKDPSFGGTKGNSAFLGCKDGTKIFLRNTSDEYTAGKLSGAFPEGWNYYSWKNNHGDDLSFYCYSATDPGSTTTEWGYWHEVAGEPVIWGS